MDEELGGTYKMSGSQERLKEQGTLQSQGEKSAVDEVKLSSPVSIQTQSLALRALRKRKPQETQALALASSQSWMPLLRPSIPIGWRLRLLREIFNEWKPRASA